MTKFAEREAAHAKWRARGEPTSAAAVVMVPGLVLLERGPKANRLPGLPGGKREPGETVTETAMRELLEETGVEGRTSNLICTVQADQHLCAIIMVHTFAAPKPLPNGVTWEHPIALLKGSRYPDVYAWVLSYMVGLGFPLVSMMERR